MGSNLDPIVRKARTNTKNAIRARTNSTKIGDLSVDQIRDYISNMSDAKRMAYLGRISFLLSSAKQKPSSPTNNTVINTLTILSKWFTDPRTVDEVDASVVGLVEMILLSKG